MSWKQWIVALSTVVLTTQFTPANADSSYRSNDCGYNFCDCDPCEGWSAYVDYLYWTVRNCDQDYAVRYDGHKLYHVDPTYDSGVRVGILKACDDMDFAIHYTYFKSKDHDSVFDENGQLVRTRGYDSEYTVNGDIQYASSHYSVQLNQLDVEAGYHLEMSDCFASRLFGGFRYANIKQNLRTTYIEELDVSLNFEVDKIFQSTDMNFYGLYLGGKTSYNICDCFDIFGGLSLGLGVGDFDRSYKANGIHNLTADEEYFHKHRLNGDCWRSVGVLDLNVGITFPLCNVCCTDWALSFGYEFHHWFNASGFITYHEELDHVHEGSVEVVRKKVSLDRHTADLGFDGLFVRLSAAF